MTDEKLKSAIEAILFASGEPLPAARLSLALGVAEEDIYSCADALAEEYESNGRGIRLLRLGANLQLCSSPEFAKEAARAIEHRAPPRLSQSALEALAIIAYFQPVTRAYVEQVRGVDSSYTLLAGRQGPDCARGKARSAGPAHALPHDGRFPESHGRELARRTAAAAGYVRDGRNGQAAGGYR